ncbi:hypothetical protein EG68_09520 [Paragonimus skrjabini miyazakii]|uniref:Uncharacterized protein n=1 Tax=Paragonimus skrjabini miyazakii TaxID=59628 RepID=A0A8S9YLG1_9TREM|nr:hypothetical protein EG68_09520 [Paragonimus skrjabini miyazakii]
MLAEHDLVVYRKKGDAELTTQHMLIHHYELALVLSTDSVTTVETTTRGGGNEESNGRSADTTAASPVPDQTSTSNDSVTTVETTTRGGGSKLIDILVFRLNLFACLHFERSTRVALSIVNVHFQVAG